MIFAPHVAFRSNVYTCLWAKLLPAGGVGTPLWPVIRRVPAVCPLASPSRCLFISPFTAAEGAQCPPAGATSLRKILNVGGVEPRDGSSRWTWISSLVCELRAFEISLTPNYQPQMDECKTMKEHWEIVLNQLFFTASIQRPYELRAPVLI